MCAIQKSGSMHKAIKLAETSETMKKMTPITLPSEVFCLHLDVKSASTVGKIRVTMAFFALQNDLRSHLSKYYTRTALMPASNWPVKL